MTPSYFVGYLAASQLRLHKSIGGESPREEKSDRNSSKKARAKQKPHGNMSRAFMTAKRVSSESGHGRDTEEL